MSGPKSYSPVEKAQLRAAYFATKPTGFTCYLRTSLPWQAVRFILLNLRMIRIIGLSHRGKH
ncbi:MAG: hypothetical protein Q8K67_03835 [Geothrix sp.]|nr:hypothetical protein [Geothrix sp.]